jgi:aspartate/methionine/tyrosine aminotransferase
MDHVLNLGLAMLYGLSGFMQKGALAAFERDIPEVAMMKSAYRRRRDRAWEALQGAPGIKPLMPEAGMFMMLDVRQSGMHAGEFASRLYEETGVSLLDATAFGSCAEGHVRLSFSVDDASLEEACRRILGFSQRRAVKAGAA